MKNKVQKALEQLFPYIMLGVSITLVIGLFMMLSYVFIWGALLGGVIWLAVTIKNYLFPSLSSKENEGRIIDHDDKGSKD